jgi:nuclear pore complex protein Nup155
MAFRSPPIAITLTQQSFYSSGTFLGVQTENSSTPTSKLITIVPNTGRQSVSRELFETYEAPSYHEWHCQEMMSSTVWTIAELPATNPVNSPSSGRKSDGIALNPLSRQAITEARQFLILTTSGLSTATMPQPVDLFSGELDVEKAAAIILSQN